MKHKKFLSLTLATLAVIALASASVSANHAWGSYHWARTSNPFILKIGDNVTSVWDSTLATTSSDWSLSSVLDTQIIAGSTNNPKRCSPTAGRVEVCNSKYGNNGWLGVAQIWANGSHITQGTVKLNDTYFSTATYNTPAWRNLVTCQEVGHTLGLDHQDEDFNNPPLGTCMDYTNDPTPNQHPNQHDYDELELIYAHLDSSTTVGQTISQANANSAADSDNPSEWGGQIRSKGHSAVFERDLGNGHKLFTFVIYS